MFATFTKKKNKWDLKLLFLLLPLQYISCQINSLSNICSIIFNSSSDSLWYETPHQIRASKRFFRHLGRVGRYEAVMQSRTSGGLKPAYWPSHNHVVTYCLPSFHTNIMNSLFSFRWNFDISFCNFWHFTIVHTYHILLESSWKIVL